MSLTETSIHSSQAPQAPPTFGRKSVWRDDRRVELPESSRPAFQVIGTAYAAEELPASEFPEHRASHFDFPARPDAVTIRFRRGADRGLRFVSEHGEAGATSVIVFRGIAKAGTYLFLTEDEFAAQPFAHLHDS